VGAGEFVVMNEVLVRDLIARGKWTKEVKNSIIRNNGSVQHLPDDVLDGVGKALHKTAWEISMKVVIDHAKFRAPFIDQSMSMNLWMEKADYASMTSMLFYAWKAGLKTLIYYLRTRAIASPQQVTIPVEEGGNPTEANAMPAKPKSDATEAEKQAYEEAKLACSRANPEACVMCSS
jgi:ribonucleoside-diphosphate reductase alpha chain